MTASAPPLQTATPNTTARIPLDNLVVRYGAIEALHGVSLRVEQGKIVTLIGANGAGKSSLLRCISGLVPAFSGTIHYDPDCNLSQSNGNNVGGNGKAGAGQKSKINLCRC